MLTTRNLTTGHRAALYAALTGALMFAACATAPAAAASPEPSVRVSLHGLNLATAAGQETLLARLNGAARKVCDVEDIRNLAAVAASSACQRSAVARAVLTVHGAHLAAADAAVKPRG